MAFAAVVVCAALGIGANAALLALIHGLLVNPLPSVRQPDRLLVAAWQQVRGPVRHPLSPSELEGLTAATDGLLRWAGFSWTDLALRTEAEPLALVRAMVVTPGYFEVLGVEAARGRLVGDREPGVVVSHRFWQSRLGGDPDVLGRSLNLAGRSVPIVGVAPAGFGGTVLFDPAALWIPLRLFREIEGPVSPRVADPSLRWLQVIGRLAPGTDPSVAGRAGRSVGERLAESGARGGEEVELVLRPAVEAVLGSRGHGMARRAATLLLSISALVLLIACFDIVFLFLVKQSEERGELVLRASLGARKGVLLRQGLTDAALPVLIGGALGALAGPPALAVLWRWIRPPFLRQPPVPVLPELQVWVVMAIVVVGVLAIVAVVPILSALRSDPARILRQDGPTATASRSRRSFLSILLGAQLALSVVALCIAVLFLRSLGQGEEADLGFRVAGLGSIPVRSTGATDRVPLDRLALRLERIAGVGGVTVASRLPLSLSSVAVAGLGPGGDAGSGGFTALVERVGPRYFTVLDLPLLEGRAFDRDARVSEPVAVINESLSERMWPGESPIGLWIRSPDLEAPVQVVGVAVDSKLVTIWERPRPTVYLPAARDELSSGVLIFRCSQPPATVLPKVRLALANAAPNLLVGEAVDMRRTVEDSLWAPRLAAGLFSGLGGLSLVLVLTGLYGTAAFSARQRTAEMAVRQAFGASPARVGRHLAGSGLLVTVVGILTGVLAALGLGRLLASLLIGIRPYDPATFLGVGALLLATSLLLHLLPIRRLLKASIARTLGES